MTRFRYSLTGLMIVVAFAAVVFAGLRSSGELWGRIAFAACTNILPIAVQSAVFSRERRRVFWLGFAVVGWGNWLIGCGPGIENHMQDRLLARSITDYLHPKLQQNVKQPAFPPPNNYRANRPISEPSLARHSFDADATACGARRRRGWFFSCEAHRRFEAAGGGRYHRRRTSGVCATTSTA